MTTYAAYITLRDGIPRRVALISQDRDGALREARLLALSIFGRGFTYCVRPA